MASSILARRCSILSSCVSSSPASSSAEAGIPSASARGPASCGYSGRSPRSILPMVAAPSLGMAAARASSSRFWNPARTRAATIRRPMAAWSMRGTVSRWCCDEREKFLISLDFLRRRVDTCDMASLNRAKQLRLDKGLGLVEAASAAGVNHVTVRRVEEGLEVRAASLAKLAAYYGVQPTSLVLPAVYSEPEAA